MSARVKVKFKKKAMARLSQRRVKPQAPQPSHRVRVDWHEYFMNIAREVATRSTCDRKHVGAVIVRDKTILSTGYNGSVKGMPHCDDAGAYDGRQSLRGHHPRRVQRGHSSGPQRGAAGGRRKFT